MYPGRRTNGDDPMILEDGDCSTLDSNSKDILYRYA